MRRFARRFKQLKASESMTMAQKIEEPQKIMNITFNFGVAVYGSSSAEYACLLLTHSENVLREVAARLCGCAKKSRVFS